MVESLLFIIMSLITIACAIGVVFQKNPIYSAVFLIQTMVSIAVLYVLLHAQFVAAVQVMVYAGAIMVIFVFVIMLLNLNKDTLESDRNKLPMQKPVAITLGLILVVMIGIIMARSIYQGAEGEYPP